MLDGRSFSGSVRCFDFDPSGPVREPSPFLDPGLRVFDDGVIDLECWRHSMFSESVCSADLLWSCGFGLAFQLVVGECDWRWRAGVEPCAVAPSHFGEFEVAFPFLVFGGFGFFLVGEGREVVLVLVLGGEAGYGVGA